MYWSIVAFVNRNGRDIDHLDHVHGDDCLRRVAQALVASIRQSCEFASRYGGEEFAVILPELTTSNALDVSERLCEKGCVAPSGGWLCHMVKARLRT
jgi:diguanylate cyclase (GGDEF)-like protein